MNSVFVYVLICWPGVLGTLKGSTTILVMGRFLMEGTKTKCSPCNDSERFKLKTSFTESRISLLDECTSMDHAHPSYAHIILQMSLRTPHLDACTSMEHAHSSYVCMILPCHSHIGSSLSQNFTSKSYTYT